VPAETTSGSRIETTRTQLGLTPSQLARRVGVKRKTLENWENDRSEPRADKLLKLAGVLQVPIVWLITGDVPPSSDHSPAASETARIAQKLERAVAMQRNLAALLIEVSADVARLQRGLDNGQRIAA
jgi:transcriptional regulator with XRE-family HTH domain